MEVSDSLFLGFVTPPNKRARKSEGNPELPNHIA